MSFALTTYFNRATSHSFWKQPYVCYGSFSGGSQPCIVVGIGNNQTLPFLLIER